MPLEVRPDVKHTEGVLSMGRFDDPNRCVARDIFTAHGAVPKGRS